MSGFADLRVNQVAHRAEESFWPSFTDIMAVVVMIFLITTSVLILRNWELIKQITRTAAAEQRAMELALETSKEKATAEEQLEEAKYRITVLRLELLRSERERQRRRAELAEQREESARLNVILSDLEARLADETRSKQEIEAQVQRLAAAQTVLEVQLDQEVRSKATLSDALEKLAAQLTELQSRYDSSSAQLAESRASLERTTRELSTLRTDYRAREQEIEALREDAVLVEARYASLVGDYDDLQVKYNKLIRPARSASGKYVVEVRYWRGDGEYRLSMREPQDETFRPMSLEKLHQSLGALHDRMPEQLYIRIIFPEESGLSYAEAWEFTQDLLSKYDYYHREQ